MIATIEFIVILVLFFVIFKQNAQHSKVLASLEAGMKAVALKLETAIKKI